MGKQLPLARREFGSRALKIPTVCGFDIETEGLGGPFILGTWYVNEEENGFFYSLDSFVDFILEHPAYRYLAHNAKGYEFAYFLPYLYRRFLFEDNIDILPTIQGENSIIQIRIIVHTYKTNRKGVKKDKKTVIDLRDTLCLFNNSLEGVANAFCPDIPKLVGTIDWEKETFNPDNPTHRVYAMRDSEIVVKAYYKAAEQQLELFNSPLGLTAGATAMNAFMTTIPENKCYWRLKPEVDAFVRKCYYGGLVLPGHKVGKWGPTGSVDVNGAFAYQMRTHSFPVGTPSGTWEYVPGKTGFYRVIATVPEHLFYTLGFNPVPCRTKEGLCWPSGRFETYLSSYEIDYASAKGCTFEVICGYFWSRKERIFDTFIDKCQEYELRDGGIYKPLSKLERNALYGKFATKELHNTIEYSHTLPEDNPKNLIPLTNSETGEIIDGVYVGQEISSSPYMLPHWGALITAWQRVYLMGFIEEMYKRGASSVYCDTDSIKCELHIVLEAISDGCIPIGNNYGAFKFEDVCREFTVLGGKCYLGVLSEPDKKGGYLVVKAKGVPTSRLKPVAERVYEEALLALRRPQTRGKAKKQETLNRGIRFEGVKSAMSIIKENSTVRPEVHYRTITDIRNSWAWSVDEYDNIKPRVFV